MTILTTTKQKKKIYNIDNTKQKLLVLSLTKLSDSPMTYYILTKVATTNCNTYMSRKLQEPSKEVLLQQ